MSSYLNIYVQPDIDKYSSEESKKEKAEVKPLLLLSYSRSSYIYQYFDSNGLSHYGGMDGSTSPLNVKDIIYCIEDVDKDIKTLENKIKALKELQASEEVINEMYSNVSYLDELKEIKSNFTMLKTLIEDAEFTFNKFTYMID